MSAKATNDFTADGWSKLFAAHGLGSFEECWAREVKLFEAPNARRGGWSNVARLELARADGSRRVVFLKRQENHNRRSWRHPLRGVPTLQLEFENIRRCHERGVPALRALGFARRRVAGKDRAVLITEELAGFQSLAEITRSWNTRRPPNDGRLKIIGAVARLLRVMQSHGLRHNNFYPKHIFLHPCAGEGVEACLIDLELATWHRSVAGCGARDLRTLNRRAQGWSRADRLRFLKTYLGVNEVTPEVRHLWHRLARK